MQIEIPDPAVILSVILAFVIGLFGLYLYYHFKPYINYRQGKPDLKYLERLEYYEKQLIDMKIRMDALNIDESYTQPAQNPVSKDKKPVETSPEEKREVRPQKIMSEPVPTIQSDVINHVLKLIMNKAMTSRDIQITIGRTREHTSRLMKKLFEDGYVQRRTGTRPYTYSITEKGRSKVGLLKNIQN